MGNSALYVLNVVDRECVPTVDDVINASSVVAAVFVRTGAIALDARIAVVRSCVYTTDSAIRVQSVLARIRCCMAIRSVVFA